MHAYKVAHERVYSFVCLCLAIRPTTYRKFQMSAFKHLYTDVNVYCSSAESESEGLLPDCIALAVKDLDWERSRLKVAVKSFGGG